MIRSRLAGGLPVEDGKEVHWLVQALVATTAGDEIERRMKLGKEQIARLQRLKIRLTAWTPEIYFVRLSRRKETEPVVTRDSNEQFHADDDSEEYTRRTILRGQIGDAVEAR